MIKMILKNYLDTLLTPLLVMLGNRSVILETGRKCLLDSGEPSKFVK